jgi:hypothetical protein
MHTQLRTSKERWKRAEMAVLVQLCLLRFPAVKWSRSEARSPVLEPLAVLKGLVPHEGNGSLASSGCSTCSSSDAALGQNVEITSLKQERAETSQLAESTGGLKWSLPKDATMEDVAILWIGDEGAALTNLLLTYNKNTTVRYAPWN